MRPGVTGMRFTRHPRLSSIRQACAISSPSCPLVESIAISSAASRSTSFVIAVVPSVSLTMYGLRVLDFLVHRSRTIQDRMSLDSFGSRATIMVDGRAYTIYRLDALSAIAGSATARLPVTLKVLLENLLRNEDGAFVKRADIETLARWDAKAGAEREIAFRTSRVLLQDFTGVPAVVDLAAMRDAIASLGGDPALINPLQPVDLVIDHSVQVDEYGSDAAFLINAGLEFDRNKRALRVSALGPDGIPEFPRRAARHGHRAPDQSRVSRAGRLHRHERRHDRRLSATRSSAPIRTRR